MKEDHLSAQRRSRIHRAIRSGHLERGLGTRIFSTRRAALLCAPDARQDDGDGQHLAPENLCSGHCRGLGCGRSVAQVPDRSRRNLANFNLQWRVCRGFVYVSFVGHAYRNGR